MYRTFSTNLGRLILYLFAVMSIAAATFLIGLITWPGPRMPALLLLAAVSIVTWFGGWRAGMLAIILAAGTLAWGFLPPLGSFRIDSPDDVLLLFMFVFVATLIASLHASRERARNRSMDTERRLAFALEAANMGAWSCDLRARHLWYSPSMASLLGCPAGTVAGTADQFLRHVHPDDQPAVRDAIALALEQGRDFELEHRIVHPDGQTLWLISRGRVVHDRSSRPAQLIVIATNITASKTASPTPAQ